MRLGIYGGTFDPIHIAHLIIAEHARSQFSLTRVLFMPCFIPPHKRDQSISSAQQRLEMVSLAIFGHPDFDVSDFEIEREGASYTVDTLDYFAGTYGLDRDHLFLIIGADNLADFDKWREPERILRLSTVVVAGRPGRDLKTPLAFHGQPVHAIPAPLMDISASQIRKRVREGGSIRYLTPKPVEEYIFKNKLYQSVAVVEVQDEQF